MTEFPGIDKAMLIAVDVQTGFVSEHSEGVLPNIRRVVSAWQDAGGVNVLTQFVNEPGSPYVRLIGWDDMMPDDPQVSFDPHVADLTSLATAIVRKNRYSSLTSESLEILGSSGLRDVCIIGLDTESCVLATALTAFEQDYTPWIITDAVASHAGPEAHAAGLLVAGRYLGQRQLITTHDVAPLRTKVL